MASGQMLSLAVQHHQAGNLREAETLYRHILKEEPNHVDALHMLGVMAHQSGRNDLALEYIRQAITLRPDFPAALNNFGIVLKDLGKHDEAAASYQQALRLRPAFPEAIYNLANSLKSQGKLTDAIANYRHALRLKPDYVEAYNNLGNALKDQGKHTEAIASYHEALRLRPQHVEAHNNLGNALKDLGRLEEAIASYQQALRFKPHYAEAYNNMGIVLKEQGKVSEALANIHQALRLQPHFAEAKINLGNVLQDQGKIDEAIENYRQALQLKPNSADAHCNLGVALSESGRIDEAIATFRETIRLKPNQAEALSQLAGVLRGRLPDVDRVHIERCLADPDLNNADRVKLLFGLAEVCDAKREYAQAALLLRQANALTLSLHRDKGQNYHRDDNARLVENLMKAFTPAFFERVRGSGLQTERPVFIVGLPRSGTTLTEQILAAHSQVHGAGELDFGRRDFLALGALPTDDSVFATLPFLSGEAFQRIAKVHLEHLEAMSPTAARIVDKMPDNYLSLGLLAALFPKAKFIHCRRDLRDVAVSCWMTNFRDVRWANDPEDLAVRFREYRQLMEHWRTVLPVPVLEMNYEETVSDLPAAARRLVEWCGLDWEPGCLKFHEGIRPVRTASKIQVREPVYTRSVGRWRHYEQEMPELLAPLAPLIDGQS